MEIHRVEKCPPKNPNLLVKVTEMGHVIDVQYMSRRNTKATIQMLDGGEQYILLSTGEVCDVVHHDTRADQKNSLYRTFATIRGIINSNVTMIENIKWVTLTYAENMMDSKRLYNDFERFNKRFQYYIAKQGFNKAEYIVVMEPQGRGAWHAHLLYIFDKKAPYIPNDTMAELWRNGFTKTKKLDSNIDNLGAYLTAYLGDMEVNDMITSGLAQNIEGSDVKVVEYEDTDTHEMSKKYYIKGGRLPLYPANFNMYRCSRGVKRPVEAMETQEMAENKVSAGTLTYEKTVILKDIEHDFESVINSCQYNMKRKLAQPV